MNKKIDFFNTRINKIKDHINEFNSTYNLISLLRIIVFILFVISGIWGLNIKSLPVLVISVLAFLSVFIFLVLRHRKVRRGKILNQKLLRINQDELKRKNFDFDGIYEAKDFINESHPYTSDLDIFGRNSIFQLINRAGTSHGIKLLKSWLENAAYIQIIYIRQQAVKELIPHVDWRQKMQAYGQLKVDKRENLQAFNEWLDGQDFINNSFLYRLIPYIISLISIGILTACIIGWTSFYFLLFPIAITGYFILQILDYAKKTYLLTQHGIEILESIMNMVILVENQSFIQDHLNNLKLNLISQYLKSSDKIDELRKIFEWLSLRGNQYYHLFNSFFLLDFFILGKAEKWREKYRKEVEVWFDTIAEFEALNSLAAFAFANENYSFPKIESESYYLKGEDIGHPLIPDETRVNNNFTFQGQGNTCIITGSNMSGKSTFLRTIGVNAVLAFAGAPVCAKLFQLGHFQVFTGMRTKDNLEENISSFYAELLRLKLMFEYIGEMRPVLYLLDEILKGTNSVDRHLGAESLILQLNESNAFGLVSTHDLKLGELQKTNGRILNYNFSSSIIEQEIVFDYKLRDGICESTNASQLMAKIGIKIKS